MERGMTMQLAGRMVLMIGVAIVFMMLLGRAYGQGESFGMGLIDDLKLWLGLNPDVRAPRFVSVTYGLYERVFTAVAKISLPPNQELTCSPGSTTGPTDEARSNKVVECDVPIEPQGRTYGKVDIAYTSRTVIGEDEDERKVFPFRNSFVRFIKTDVSRLQADGFFSVELDEFASEAVCFSLSQQTEPVERLSSKINHDNATMRPAPPNTLLERFPTLKELSAFCTTAQSVCSSTLNCPISENELRKFVADCKKLKSGVPGQSNKCESIDRPLAECLEEDLLPKIADELTKCDIQPGVFATIDYYYITPEGIGGGYLEPMPRSPYYFVSAVSRTDDTIEPVPIADPVPQYTASDFELSDPVNVIRSNPDLKLIMPYVRIQTPQGVELGRVELQVKGPGIDRWFVLSPLCAQEHYQERYDRGERIYVHSALVSGSTCVNSWTVGWLENPLPGSYESSLEIEDSDGNKYTYPGESIEVVAADPSAPIFRRIDYELQDGAFTATMAVTARPQQTMSCLGSPRTGSDAEYLDECVVQIIPQEAFGFIDLDVTASYEDQEDEYLLIQDGSTLSFANSGESAAVGYLHRTLEGIDPSRIFSENFRLVIDKAIDATNAPGVWSNKADEARKTIQAWPTEPAATGTEESSREINARAFDEYTNGFREFCSLVRSSCSKIDPKVCPTQGGLFDTSTDPNEPTMLDYAVSCSARTLIGLTPLSGDFSRTSDRIYECFEQATLPRILEGLDSCDLQPNAYAYGEHFFVVPDDTAVRGGYLASTPAERTFIYHKPYTHFTAATDTADLEKPVTLYVRMGLPEGVDPEYVRVEAQLTSEDGSERYFTLEPTTPRTFLPPPAGSYIYSLVDEDDLLEDLSPSLSVGRYEVLVVVSSGDSRQEFEGLPILMV